MARRKLNRNGIVFSTDPDFGSEPEGTGEAQPQRPAHEQDVRVRLDKKGRAGKVVTLVQGIEGTDAALEQTAKKLKKHCGTGGSYKDGEIVVQGDVRQKVMQWLMRSGYKKAKTD